MKIQIQTHYILAASRHIEALGKLFLCPYPNPYETYEILLKAEREAHKKATARCNGEISEENFDKWEKSFLARLKKKLNVKDLPPGFFINTDPRGYALKIGRAYHKNIEGLWSDFGGYWVLAPEFS